MRLIRRPELLRKTGLSATTIYELEKAGDFPKHVNLTPRTAVWDEAAVDEWLRKRMKSPVAPAPAPDVRLRRDRRAIVA
jgi:prophage regulatory protein